MIKVPLYAPLTPAVPDNTVVTVEMAVVPSSCMKLSKVPAETVSGEILTVALPQFVKVVKPVARPSSTSNTKTSNGLRILVFPLTTIRLNGSKEASGGQ